VTIDPFFHFVVDDVFFIKGRGTVVTGRIEQGTVHVGDEIMIRGPRGERKTIVNGIEAFRKILPEAGPGQDVGILLKDISKQDIARGDELLAPGLDFTWKP